jgi:hypothetical protein
MSEKIEPALTPHTDENVNDWCWCAGHIPEPHVSLDPRLIHYPGLRKLWQRKAPTTSTETP